MIIVVYLFTFLVSIMFSYKKFGAVINIVSLFTGLWCFFGSVSVFGMYEMRTPAIQIHIYAWIFVLTIDMVLLLFCKKARVQGIMLGNEPVVAANEFTYAPFVQGIALLLYCPMIINSVNALLTYGFIGVRSAYYGSEYEGAYLFSLLCRTIPTGLMYGLIVYYMYKAFENRRWKYFIYSFLNALILMLVNGGRYALMEVLLSALIILVMKRRLSPKDTWETKKFKKRIKRGIILVVVLMLITTVFREQKIVQSIVVYFSGSFSFLDYIVSYPSRFDLTDQLTGYMTFGCITEPVVLVLKVLGVTTMKTPSYMFNINCQNFYDIGNGSATVMFNNNTTVLYYFLRDFGIVGIVIGGIFLGSVVAYSYNKSVKGKSFFALVYIYMAVVLLNTIMTYQFFGCDPFFSILAMYCCTKRARVRIRISLGNYHEARKW